MRRFSSLNLTILTIVIFFINFNIGLAQIKKDSVNMIELDEVVLGVHRFSKPKRKISQQIESIAKKEIEFQNFQTSADALSNSGIVTIQKSQQGGGSPVIRGFESNRILLLVDGIRMNNLIYRSGHLQNIITVDKNIIENIDVLFGPSSTIFGSDALGGAIYIETKKAKTLAQSNNNRITGNIISSFSTVNNAKSTHFDFNIAGAKWASRTVFSVNDFEDLIMGKKQNGRNPFFGERKFYVENTNGVDVKVNNSNPYIQKFSGYTKYDWMQKLVYSPNNSVKHDINIQYSTSSVIPRYDRLTDLNSTGNLRSAVWNYGPQDRLLVAYTFAKKPLFSSTEFRVTASYQKVEESRITRSFGNNNQSSRIEKVNVFGLVTDFKSQLGTGQINYGFDIFYDNLNSAGTVKNIITSFETSTDSRYPDGKNNILKAESFAYYSTDVNNKTTINGSLRGGISILNSKMNTNFLNLPFTAINQQNFIYSGAFGVTHNATENAKFVFNVASAFRVPNIDDLSKIFESVPGRLIVPNSNIRPEKTITADLGFTICKGKIFKFENTIFYTWLFDAIVTAPFAIKGETSIIYENQNSLIFANQNQGIGQLYGISTFIKGYISPSLLAYGNFNYTHGRFESASGKVPLDHIAPIYGKIGLQYNFRKWNLDVFTLYNGKKSLQDYSPSGEDNL